MTPVKPGGLCTPDFSPSFLVYQAYSQVLVQKAENIDCSTLPPRPSGDINVTQIQARVVWNMCCIKDLLVLALKDGVFGYDIRSGAFGELKWRVQGRLKGMLTEMRACGVTSDGHGHLFICDSNNKCVQIFSVDGVYMRALFSGGSLGIPLRVQSQEITTSLVLLCDIGSNEAVLNVIKINKG